MAKGTKKKKIELTIEEKLEQALVPEEEWPYEVPENWCWTYVGVLCSFIGGGTPSKSNLEYWNGDIPWASVKDIKGDFLYETIDSISQMGFENSSTNICDINDLILVTRIEPAKTIVSKLKSAINQDLKIVKSNLSSSFLHYYFKTFQHEFIKKSSGSTVKGITIQNVNNTYFPLPPLAEQQRIVNRIESLFAKLDDAKEKAQAVEDGFEDRKAAILHKAFAGELTEEWRICNGTKTSDWEQVTLGEVFDLQAGKNISANRIEKERSLDCCYPCFGGNGIRGYVTEYNREGEHPIIGRQGALCGNINLAVGKFYATEHAVVVSYKKPIITSWAINYLKFLNLNQYATATAQPGLAVRTINTIPIIYMPYEEQKEIANQIDSLAEKEYRAQAFAEQAIYQIKTIKKSILARAFRGELGTNDPADESAEELLKRIL